MATNTSTLGDVNHILVTDEETNNKTLITCGDWTKAEELGVTEYAKEVWTEELLKKFEDMEAYLAPTDYSVKRATEYPALAEQLDEIYHNGIDSWKAIIKKTKDKFPKPA